METEKLQRNLRERFGLVDFRPGQVDAIQGLLAGKHALVVMPTGAGKSLIFQFAAIEMPGTTIVISPLIALMKDQTDALEKRGIAATFVNSSIDASEQARRLYGVSKGRFKIVYVAPERLRSEIFGKTLQTIRVSLLAVDEAHCISQWGHDFRPDYMQIGPNRARLGNPTTVALTATATQKVQEDIIGQLGIPTAARIVTGFNRPNLVFKVRYSSEEEDKYEALQEFLASAPQAFGTQEGLDAPGIVYVGTRRHAEEVARFVRDVCGVEALFYHGGMESDARSRVQEAFMCGDVPMVVATNAFGMGIDRADIRFVLHFALPGSLEAYYQEAGRAGRDALPADCVLLYSPKDRALQEWFIKNETLSRQETLALFESISSRHKKGAVKLTDEDISQATGLHAVKVRTGLAQLELAGGIERLGDEGPLMHLRIGTLDPKRLMSADQEAQRRRQRKEAELAKMVAYAEANTCRRRTILDHFGDAAEPRAEVCCDNCLSSQDKPPHGDITDGTKLPDGGTTSETATTRTLTKVERIPLAILDTVRTLKWEAGRKKLAQLLKGSRAADIIRFGYHRSKYYGRLADMQLADIEDLIEQLTKTGHLKRVGGEFPVLRLAPPGEKAIESRATIPLKSPAYRTRKKAASGRAGEETIEVTRNLFRQGLTPQQIAAQRSLTEDTVYSHLARLIAQGNASLDAVVPRSVQEQVRAAITKVGTAAYLSPVRAILPESVTYNQIRCVRAAMPEESPRTGAVSETRMAAKERSKKLSPSHAMLDEALLAALKKWRRERASARNLPAFCVFHDSVLHELAKERPACLDALVRIRGIGVSKVREYGRDLLDLIRNVEMRSSGKTSPADFQTMAASSDTRRNGCGALTPDASSEQGSAGMKPSPTEVAAGIKPAATRDAVRSFLTSAHPQPLAGNWNCGWALDFNSRFSGSEWTRTAVGEILYRYKYQGDRDLVEELSERLARVAAEHAELKGADTIVPVPPSLSREFDPVSELCGAVGRLLGMPVAFRGLAKIRSTSPQKDFGTLAQKRGNVAGVFAVPEESKTIVKNKRILLVDDLFDSGATLQEAAKALFRAGAASVSVMTVVKTIHSER